jgi:hypothetical protein
MILERYTLLLAANRPLLNCQDSGATGRYRNDLYSPRLQLLPSISTYGIAALGFAGTLWTYGVHFYSTGELQNVNLQVQVGHDRL